MKQAKKYRIINAPVRYNDLLPEYEQYSNYNYNSRSFIIRFYARIPFVHSLKNIELTQNTRVLELGCADGPFLPTLNYYAKSTVAIDIDQRFINEAKRIVNNDIYKLTKINLLCSDGHSLPFKDESFDVIFCLEVLEHVKNPEEVIGEIYRLLKKGGTLICTVPVEIGISLFVRTLIAKFTKYKRSVYTRKELIQSALLRRPGERTEVMEHKNFDWRKIKKELKNAFKRIKVRYAPVNIFRDLNPIVLFKAVKK